MSESLPIRIAFFFGSDIIGKQKTACIFSAVRSRSRNVQNGDRACRCERKKTAASALEKSGTFFCVRFHKNALSSESESAYALCMSPVESRRVCEIEMPHPKISVSAYANDV